MILNTIFPLCTLRTLYEHQSMAKPCWQDPVGLETINTIVKKVIPLWTNGLHTVQLELISAILDGQDLLCCTATGDGKSEAFSISCLVLLEYNQHPESYLANQPTCLRSIGVVVTPTKGLASNIVCLPSLKTFCH
jgi:superfamily II DNA helicase RecQ